MEVPVSDLLVRDLDDRVIDQLRARAELRGRSVEQEARDLLTAAAPLTAADKLALVRRLRARMPDLSHVDVEALIRSGREEDLA
jgi:plasmid stability protein